MIRIGVRLFVAGGKAAHFLLWKSGTSNRVLVKTGDNDRLVWKASTP